MKKNIKILLNFSNFKMNSNLQTKESYSKTNYLAGKYISSSFEKAKLFFNKGRSVGPIDCKLCMIKSITGILATL